MKKLIKRIIKKFFDNRFRRRDKRLLKQAIKDADYMNHVTGKTIWVISSGKEYRVIDREWIKEYNRMIKGQPIKKLDHLELLKKAIYKTSEGSLTNRKK